MTQISIGKVNYVLAKLANQFGGHKIAKLAFDKLQTKILNQNWTEEVEAEALLAKSKQHKDSKEAGLFCPRCRSEVQTLGEESSCGNCFYPLVFSPLSYENLPLVEFVVTGESNHDRVASV